MEKAREAVAHAMRQYFRRSKAISRDDYEGAADGVLDALRAAGWEARTPEDEPGGELACTPDLRDVLRQVHLGRRTEEDAHEWIMRMLHEVEAAVRAEARSRDLEALLREAAMRVDALLNESALLRAALAVPTREPTP
jgi:hypothetical protein